MVEPSEKSVGNAITVLTECLGRVQAARPELIASLPAARDRILEDLGA